MPLLLVLFGGLIYFGVRGVMEREPAKSNAAPAPSTAATPPPNGWPATGPTPAECEALFAGVAPDQVRTLVKMALDATDAQWAEAKAGMIATNKGKLAACLDSARKMAQTLKM